MDRSLPESASISTARKASLAVMPLGTGVPVPGGLNYREALLLMEEMNSLGLVNSMDIVEVNPILDVRNQTAIMAVNLAARILGEKLY